MHSDANVESTSVADAPSLQAPAATYDFWVTPLLFPPPAEHPVAHTLDAAPRPAFNYDSIDVFKSMICAFSVEGTEDQSFEEYEALYEQNLVSPHLTLGPHDSQSPLGNPEPEFDLRSVSEHNNDPVMGAEMIFNDATFETIPNPFFLMLWATLSFFNISVSYVTLKSCLTYELFTQTVVTLIFGLFFTIGHLSNFGFVFLTLMTVVLATLTFNLFRTLWRDLRQSFSSRKPKKRLRLTPRPSRVQQWVLDPFFKNARAEDKGVSQFKKNLMPNIGVHCVRPDGPAATNKDTRQLIVSKINTVKMSEAKVKFIDSRPYLNVTLCDSFQIKALYDLGASSCTIRRAVLNRMEAISPVPRIPYGHRIAGFIANAETSSNEVAYVSFTLDSGYPLERIPMLVVDDSSPYDIIIGNNIVRARRWNNYWDNDDFYVDFNNPTYKPVKATFLSDSSLSTVTIAALELQPMQTLTTELSVPSLCGYDSNFHRQDLYVSSFDTDGIIIQDALTKVK